MTVGLLRRSLGADISKLLCGLKNLMMPFVDRPRGPLIPPPYQFSLDNCMRSDPNIV